MADRSPPLAPTALWIGASASPWKLGALYRLTPQYHTPTTVACTPIPDAADSELHPKRGQERVSFQQTAVWPITDDAAWQRIVDLRAAWQQQLDAYADALRGLGGYASRLAAAGGDKRAPNPLSASVVQCIDPDRREHTGYWMDYTPRATRKPVTRHTPKMLSGGAFTFSQVDCFVCPDDAAWDAVQAAYASAESAREAFRRALMEIRSYAENRIRSSIRAVEPAPLALAPATGVVMLSADEARACIARINQSLESIRADLLELHDGEGWRALGYDSWRACVTTEFGQSQSYLYRQLAAAELERDLGFAIGETPESHLRPLAGLPVETARQAMARADQIAGDAPRQAKHVEAAVQQLTQSATDSHQVAAAPPEAIDASAAQLMLLSQDRDLFVEMQRNDLEITGARRIAGELIWTVAHPAWRGGPLDKNLSGLQALAASYAAARCRRCAAPIAPYGDAYCAACAAAAAAESERDAANRDLRIAHVIHSLSDRHLALFEALARWMSDDEMDLAAWLRMAARAEATIDVLLWSV